MISGGGFGQWYSQPPVEALGLDQTRLCRFRSYVGNEDTQGKNTSVLGTTRIPRVTSNCSHTLRMSLPDLTHRPT